MCYKISTFFFTKNYIFALLYTVLKDEFNFSFQNSFPIFNIKLMKKKYIKQIVVH